MLNWLSLPLRINAWASMFRYGIGHEIKWIGVNGITVAKVLHSYGIPTYDIRVYKKSLGVRVPAKQRGFAEYLLLRYGITLASAVLPENEGVEKGKMPVLWERPKGWTGLHGFFMYILGVKPLKEEGKSGAKTGKRTKSKKR